MLHTITTYLIAKNAKYITNRDLQKQNRRKIKNEVNDISKKVPQIFSQEMDSHFWERNFSTGEITNMTKEELRTEKEDMLERHQKEIYNLGIKYLHLNKKYNLNDVITDGHRTMIVTGYSLSYFGRYFPTLYYTGKLLTAKLTPRKDGETYSMEFSDKVIKIW